MSKRRIVKVESVLNSQIPSFLNLESPLFQEFLSQYYKSLSHITGVYNIVDNLSDYKNIDTYNSDVFYTSTDLNKCYLTEDVFKYDDEIFVSSTEGFPTKYGLIQINDEIITYLSKTETSFVDCYRGFSGISNIKDIDDTTGLVFLESSSSEHTSKTTVENLNLVFYRKLFEKFKAHYFPDFEQREFNPNVGLELILNRARDFYLSKGTDVSFNILFEILYNKKVSIFKPQELVIKTSSGDNLVTKNILVEPIDSVFTPTDLIGKTIYQVLGDISASASIYNVEFRPTDNLNLYEISLDSESFVYDFKLSQKTNVIEVVNDGIFVDSTVGFPKAGTLYVKSRDLTGDITFSTLTYSSKTLTKFLEISNLNESLVKEGDEVLEDNFLYIQTDSSLLKFRLINVIDQFDFSETYQCEVNDTINVVSFGENFPDSPEYYSWIYNYPTYHNIKSTLGYSITLYDPVKVRPNEEIQIYYSDNSTFTTRVVGILNNSMLLVENLSPIQGISATKIKRIIQKSSLNVTEPAYVQNTYINQDNDSLIVASSGVPRYDLSDLKLNSYQFTISNTEDDSNIFSTSPRHNMLSGTKVYLKSNINGISDDYYFVKKITQNKICLFSSSGDLYSSSINNDDSSAISGVGTGIITIFGYEEEKQNFSNQLLLKEFKVKKTLNRNKQVLSGKIYNIEDVYNEF